MARELNTDCVVLPIILTQDVAQVDGNSRKLLPPVHRGFESTSGVPVTRSAKQNREWLHMLTGYMPHLNKNKRPRNKPTIDRKRYKKNSFSGGQ